MTQLLLEVRLLYKTTNNSYILSRSGDKCAVSDFWDIWGEIWNPMKTILNLLNKETSFDGSFQNLQL